MLRLTVKACSDQEVVLEVVGWVEGKDVALLEEEMHRVGASCQQLVLDLHQVESIDAAGLALLRRWAGPPLALCQASTYLQALLATEGLKTV